MKEPIPSLHFMPGLEAAWPGHQEGLSNNPAFDHMCRAHVLLMCTLRGGWEKHTRVVHYGINAPPLEGD